MGPIEVLLGNDIVVTVPSDTAATVTEVSEGQFQIENSPQSTAPIVVTFQGQEIELPSGESVTVIEVAIDIKPGSDPNSIDSQDVGPGYRGPSRQRRRHLDNPARRSNQSAPAEWHGGCS